MRQICVVQTAPVIWNHYLTASVVASVFKPFSLLLKIVKSFAALLRFQETNSETSFCCLSHSLCHDCELCRYLSFFLLTGHWSVTNTGASARRQFCSCCCCNSVYYSGLSVWSRLDDAACLPVPVEGLSGRGDSLDWLWAVVFLAVYSRNNTEKGNSWLRGQTNESTLVVIEMGQPMTSSCCCAHCPLVDTL